MRLRSNSNKKVPNFSRQQSYNKDLSKTSWRKPKGIHSKLRRNIKGHGKKPRIGYATIKEKLGLVQGLIAFNVNNLKDLQNFDSKKHIIILSSTLGMKKRLLVLNDIKEKKLRVLNIENIDDYIKKIQESFKKKKELKKKKVEKKEKSQKEAEKKAEEKKEEVKAKTEEKKEADKKAEKEEQRKILEQK